jgi:nucleoside-diphosphate-sugar epimerase
VVEFYKRLLEKHHLLAHAENIFLGTGRGITPVELSSIVENVAGSKPNINWGGLDYRSMDTMHSIAPIAKAIKMLEWQPRISIEDGVARYYQLLKQHD